MSVCSTISTITYMLYNIYLAFYFYRSLYITIIFSNYKIKRTNVHRKAQQVL